MTHNNKNLLIFINDSLGELDWIAPFIQSEEAKMFNFYIYLNAPGKRYTDKKRIFDTYNLKRENVVLLNSDNSIELSLFKFDNIINKVLNRIKKYSYTLFVMTRKASDILRKVYGRLFKNRSRIKFDFIFRDYNLKDSFNLSRFEQSNPEAKVIVFPHAISIQKEHDQCPREPLKEVKADLWLENTIHSDIAKSSKQYRNIFFASGSPTLGENYSKVPLFDVTSKNVLILTRICIDEYGFGHEDGLNVFTEILEKLKSLNINAIVKHHPRDTRLGEWRKIQNHFTNVVEYEKSLNEIDIKLKACFTLFSSAPLFVLSRQVPVFEISPYKSCDNYNYQMPFHFCKNSALLTHDMLDLNLFKRVTDINDIKDELEGKNLTSTSIEQFSNCKKIFPGDANKKISKKLESMI